MREINWERLVQMMKERDLDAMVAIHPDTASYLTNIYCDTFHTNPVYHIHPVFAVATPDREVFCVDTDKPIEEAEKPPWLKNIYPRRLQLLDLDYRIQQLATGIREKGLGKGRLGYETIDTPVYIFERLKKALPEAEWVAADVVFQQTKAEKTPWEIQNQKEGVQLWDRCFTELMQTLREGETFNDVLSRLANIVFKHGSFLAWTHPGSRAWRWQPKAPDVLPRYEQVERNKVLWIDFGLRVEGYYIDMARSFVLGKASAEAKDVARKVAACQKLTADNIRPGMTCREAYDAVKAAIDRESPGQSVVVHGIGFNIEDHPIVLVQNGQDARDVHSDQLRFYPGTIFDIEPWIPEDMYLMTENGPERLSTLPMDVIEV